MLEIINLHKSYEDKTILEIPSLQIDPGIYWLQGENGSGKTTFLKILSGLIPYQGNLHLSPIGFEKKHRKEYRRKVNYAEAEPNFPSFLTGNDLIRFYEAAKGNWPSGTTLMEDFDIASYTHQTLKTYSSGMLKKLSLVLGLIGNPQVLLFDEPLITLDARAVTLFLDALRQLMKVNPDRIIFFSSHQIPDLEIFPVKQVLRVYNHGIHS